MTTAPNTTRYGMPRNEAEDLQKQAALQSPDRRSDERQTSTQSCVAENRKLRIANINEAGVMAYLEETGCEAWTLAATMAAKLDGHRLVEILTHPEAEQILLEDLQIARRIVRLAIIADAKEKESAASTERPMREANDILRMRFAPYPKRPELTPAQLCFTAEQWKTHGVNAAGWADLYDEELAEMTTTLFEHPEADISDLGQAIPPLQVHNVMDKLVGNMLTEIQSALMVKILAKTEHYQLNGCNSGLQVYRSIGKMINKRSTRRCSQAMTRTITRLIPKITELGTALLNMDKHGPSFLADEYAGNRPTYRTATCHPDNCDQRTGKRQELNFLLTAPVANIELQHPGDAGKLYNLLHEIATDIMGLDKFKTAVPRQPRKMAAGVEQGQPKQICPIF